MPRTRYLLAILLTVSLDTSAQFLDETPDKIAPAPKGVQKVIPLDVDDPTYNLWKLRRDDLNKGREPGPIDVQRFPGGVGWMGIPTFFRLPVALTPEDLEAGQVEVALLGAYTDRGFGSRGASRGPGALRLSNTEYISWGAY